MAGLVPAIHVFACGAKDVDARHEVYTRAGQRPDPVPGMTECVVRLDRQFWSGCKPARRPLRRFGHCGENGDGFDSHGFDSQVQPCAECAMAEMLVTSTCARRCQRRAFHLGVDRCAAGDSYRGCRRSFSPPRQDCPGAGRSLGKTGALFSLACLSGDSRAARSPCLPASNRTSAPARIFRLFRLLCAEVWAEFGDGVKGEAAYRGGA